MRKMQLYVLRKQLSNLYYLQITIHVNFKRVNPSVKQHTENTILGNLDGIQLV